MIYHDSLYAYSTYTLHDEKIKFDRIPSSKSNNRVVVGEYFPIRYSEESRIRIMYHLENQTDVASVLSKVTDLTHDEKCHYLYLCLSLDAYYKQKIYVMQRKDLYPLLMTEAGLKTLKRIRIKSFLESNQGTLIEKPDWYDKTPSYKIYDIGEIFNYNYGMFWEAEDTQDYLLSNIPVNKDYEYVKKFQQICEELFAKCEDFEEVNPREILLKINTSQSIDDKMTSLPNYLLKNTSLYFSEKRSAGKRVLITTGPGQGRDAIINKVCDLNTIQLINENVRNFLKKNFLKFQLTGTSEQNKRRFFRKCNKSQHFICRDIRKEGITKPKYLLKIVLSALNKRYPKVQAFKYTEFFSGPWYEGDKSERGHGLGMANELTTLIQIILFFLTNRVIGEESEYVSSSSALYLNDDAIVFVDGTTDDVETFIDYDFFVCERLGILVQKDKSFYSSECAIFCEMYYARGKPFVNDKESYILRESNIISKCSNILEAKFYLGNMKGSLDEIENLLKKAYLNLGHEFSRDEIDWPITFGGCRPFKLRGTDFSLKYLESTPDFSLMWKAYVANQFKRLFRWKKYLKEFIPPILTLFPAVKNEKDERILDKLGVTSDYNLASIFFRPTKEHCFYNSVRKLFNKRQLAYKNTTTFPTFEMFCRDYSTNSTSNVYLDTPFIKKYIEVQFFEMKNFKDPYLVTNPISAYLNTIEYDDYQSPDTAWGLFQQTTAVSIEKSVFARSRTLNTLSLIDRFEEDLDISILVFPKFEEDIDEFMESYPKPFLTSELVINGNKLPILKDDFRNPDLKLRKEVYRRYLNFREVILSQTKTWREMRNIITFETYYKGFIEFDNDFWEQVDKRLKVRRDGKSSSSSSNDDDDEDDPGKAYVNSMPSSVKITPIELTIPGSVSESEEELVIDTVQKNMFMIESGPLPEGDISVYGSVDWVKWFINLDDHELYDVASQDKDLEYASTDVIALRRGFIPSNIMNERNDNLKNNVRTSAQSSWIAFYYVEDIFNKKTEEDENIEINLFGDED